MLYLNHEEEKTKVLGPGVRYVVWVQGCKRRCPGCINPLGQPLSENGYWKSVAALEQDILHVEGLTGITISGGEPFLQAEALAKLVKLIKENSKLDIMLYSGYTLKQLRDMQNAAVDYILGHIDLLVDGEYVEELNHNTIYRGSDNQVIHFLSSKYISFREKINNTHNRSVEFVYKNDDLFLVGIPEKGFDKKFWQNLQKVYLNKSREDIK